MHDPANHCEDTVRRVALVVGLSAYQHQCDLDNAANDAKLVAATLKARSFTVVTPVVFDLQGLEAAIEEFESEIKQAGSEQAPVFKVAFFAGHGFEVAGAAYFLPSDFPDRVSPGSLGYCGISLQRIVQALSSCAGPSVVILDVCRGSVATSLPSDASALSDLVRQNREIYQKAAQAHDLLIAYSTSAGDVAGDGLDGNSRYTRALCALMLRHDLHVPEVFAEATAVVIAQTAALQRPWNYTSLTKGVKFSDLPNPRLTGSTVFMHPASRISRLCPLLDSFLYYNQTRVLMFRGLESEIAARVPADVEGVAVTARSILIADAQGTLHWQDRAGLRAIAQHGVTDAAGIEVSPSGTRVAVFGVHAFSVMAISATGEARMTLPAKVHRHSFHGATWINDDRLVVCCSNGTLTVVTFTARGHRVREVDLDHHLPCYDAEVLSGYGMLAVSAAAGRLDFLDLETLAPISRCDLRHVAINHADTYSHLREAGVSRSKALADLESPEAVLAAYTDADEREALLNALPTRHLLCLAQAADPRVLAVGADDGFVILLDIRTQEVVHTIDVGGGRGENLAWMTTAGDGALMVLSVNSVMSRYRLEPVR